MVNNTAKYDKQRPKVNPPHVSLATARRMAGLTMDDLIERIYELTEQRYTRGAISAIERGHRGASPALLRAMETAYDIRAGEIVTDYEPNPSRRVDAVA